MATTVDPRSPSESKLEATERLRQEGRWEEASRYREGERQRLRSEGKPRKEAFEKSWELMIRMYPPPDREALESYFTRSDFPPSCCPQVLQPDFTHVWRVFCRIKGQCCYLEPGLAQRDAGKNATDARMDFEDPDWMGLDVPCNGTKALYTWAIGAPQTFLDLAHNMFTKLHGELSGESPLVDATKAELQAHLDALPALRVAVGKHWRDEFTGVVNFYE